jgi:hypothetical protein
MGRKLSTTHARPNKDRPRHGAVAMTSGDWRLRALRREHSHHVVTGLVVDDAGPSDWGARLKLLGR